METSADELVVVSQHVVKKSDGEVMKWMELDSAVAGMALVTFQQKLAVRQQVGRLVHEFVERVW